MADTKTILITGASSGIGLDAAMALAKRGHQVIATAKNETRVAAVLDEAKRNHVELKAFKLDVTDPVDLKSLQELKLDVLINNAGKGESGPLAEIPLDRVRSNFETNVMGMLAVCQAVIPGMLVQGYGRIVNVSSVLGRISLPFLGAYGMTKWAVETMSDTLRQELEPKGIKIVVIEPGNIQTGFNQRMAETKYEWLSPEHSMFKDEIEQMKRHDANLANGASTTHAVVEAIIQAVEAVKPKTRYIAPKNYRWMVKAWMRMPDRLKDKIARHYQSR